MKAIAFSIGKLLLLSLGFMLCWMLAFGFSQAIIQETFPSTNESSGSVLGSMLLISLLETAVLIWANAHLKGGFSRHFGILILLVFGIQFFMSQNEAWYFRDAVGMSNRGIVQTLLGGLLLSLMFTGLWMLINRKKAVRGQETGLALRLWPNLSGLILLVYPLLYLLAGHFIAWQFPAVRQYYSGSAQNAGFVEMIIAYFRDGLYFWQVLRAIFWILITLPYLRNFQGSKWQAAITTGALYSILHCSQLLLPNPYMPAVVRYPHLLETASSTFVWGFLVAWLLAGGLKTNRDHSPA